MIRLATVAALLLAMTACGGGPAMDDPLAPIPTDVDPRDVAPPQLRVEWSVEPDPDTEERQSDDGETEAPRPTRRPALDADNAYVVLGARLLARDATDGSARWEVSAPGSVLLPPIVAGERVAIVSPGRWTWLDRDGGVAGVLAVDTPPIAAVAVEDRIVELLPTAVRALDLDPETGPAVAWTQDLEGGVAVTATTDGARLLVVSESGAVHALAAADGGRQWTQAKAAAIDAPVAVDADRAYVAGRDRHLRALRLRDGDVDWRSRPFGVDLAGAPAVADDVVWAGGMSAAIQGIDADSGSSLFRVKVASRSYLDLVRWGRWIVASPTYGPWTIVRAPLKPLGPANPGAPVSYTVSSEGAELELAPAVGPQGVLLVDSAGTLRLLTPQRRGPLRSERPGGQAGDPG